MHYELTIRSMKIHIDYLPTYYTKKKGNKYIFFGFLCLLLKYV